MNSSFTKEPLHILQLDQLVIIQRIRHSIQIHRRISLPQPSTVDVFSFHHP